MTKPWFKVSRAHWCVLRDTLTHPWLPGAAAIDLAYWAHEFTDERPSIRALADAWGWRKDRVHRAIKLHATTSRQDADNGATTSRQATPDEGVLSATNNDEPATDAGQETDNSETAPDDKQGQMAIIGGSEREIRAKTSRVYVIVPQVWAALRTFNKHLRKSAGKRAEALIAERLAVWSAHDLITVVRWAHSGANPWYFEGPGRLAPKVLFSVKALPYNVVNSQRWLARGAPQGAQPTVETPVARAWRLINAVGITSREEAQDVMGVLYRPAVAALGRTSAANREGLSGVPVNWRGRLRVEFEAAWADVGGPQ